MTPPFPHPTPTPPPLPRLLQLPAITSPLSLPQACQQSAHLYHHHRTAHTSVHHHRLAPPLHSFVFTAYLQLSTLYPLSISLNHSTIQGGKVPRERRVLSHPPLTRRHPTHLGNSHPIKGSDCPNWVTPRPPSLPSTFQPIPPTPPPSLSHPNPTYYSAHHHISHTPPPFRTTSLPLTGSRGQVHLSTPTQLLPSHTHQLVDTTCSTRARVTRLLHSFTSLSITRPFARRSTNSPSL